MPAATCLGSAEAAATALVRSLRTALSRAEETLKETRAQLQDALRSASEAEAARSLETRQHETATASLQASLVNMEVDYQRQLTAAQDSIQCLQQSLASFQQAAERTEISRQLRQDALGIEETRLLAKLSALNSECLARNQNISELIEQESKIRAQLVAVQHSQASLHVCVHNVSKALKLPDCNIGSLGKEDGSGALPIIESLQKVLEYFQIIRKKTASLKLNKSQLEDEIKKQRCKANELQQETSRLEGYLRSTQSRLEETKTGLGGQVAILKEFSQQLEGFHASCGQLSEFIHSVDHAGKRPGLSFHGAADGAESAILAGSPGQNASPLALWKPLAVQDLDDSVPLASTIGALEHPQQVLQRPDNPDNIAVKIRTEAPSKDYVRGDGSRALFSERRRMPLGQLNVNRLASESRGPEDNLKPLKASNQPANTRFSKLAPGNKSAAPSTFVELTNLLC